MIKKHIKKTMSMILSLGIAIGGAFAVPSIPVFADGDVAINETNFPDATFRQYVKDNFDTSSPKDSKLSVAEINAVEKIDVMNKGIKDLTGIGYFVNLQTLYCSNNSLGTIDVSQNKNLKYFFCINCDLTAINVTSNINLCELWCDENSKLSVVDVSKNDKLQRLSVTFCNLSNINIGNNIALYEFGCSGNELTSLDLSKNTNMQRVWCVGNKLTKLDVSNNSKLGMLVCDDNQISSLNLGKLQNLKGLYCTNNKLTTLDVRGTSLVNAVVNVSNEEDYTCHIKCDSSLKIIRKDSDISGGSNNNSSSNSGSKNTTPQKTSQKYSSEWVDGKWYNADGSQTYKGTMKWKCNSKGWWIEDTTGWYPTSKWQKIDGKWYYFCADGYMDYSEYRDGCWLGSDGAWVESYSGGKWSLDSTGWWYSDSSGWYPANQWLWIDGTNYNFNSKGYCTNP